MRKLLMGLGVAFALVLLLVAGGVAYVAIVGTRLDAEARAYSDRAIQEIAGHWSVDAMLRRESDELRRTVTPAQMRSVFAIFARLGPMVEYAGAKGGSATKVSAGAGKQITAVYTAHARFEHGAAQIEVVLHKEAGGWKIIGFHVNSAALMESVAGRPI